MAYRVTVTGPAERDARENHEWWAENRSATEAGRWFSGINRAIQSLKTFPNRHAYADEAALRKGSVRQMGYGLGSKTTHRVLYEVTGEEVVIYRIRSRHQDALTVEELIDG